MKEFPESGTLVPGKDEIIDGTMIAHEDYGTLVPDGGTIVELQSNLGTMVINEESTMKSEYFKILCEALYNLRYQDS